MPEHEDLELLRALRSEQEHDQLKQATKRQIDERPNHARPPELGRAKLSSNQPGPAINQRTEFSNPTGFQGVGRGLPRLAQGRVPGLIPEAEAYGAEGEGFEPSRDVMALAISRLTLFG